MQGLVLAATTLVLILTVVYACWYVIRPDTTRSIFDTPFMLPSVVYLVPLFGIVWMLHVVTISPAFNHTFVAYVGTLKRFSVLMSVALGYLLFKEGEFKKRLWVAALVVTGALLISADGIPQRLSSHMELLGL